MTAFGLSISWKAIKLSSDFRSDSGGDCCDWSLSNMVTLPPSLVWSKLAFLITQLIQDAIVEEKRFEF